MTGSLSFDDALELLGSALTFGINPSLDGIRTLTGSLARPQDTFRSMQVTGTNGKTSVTRIASALLSAHGLRTGTYTSPHLVSYTERLVVDGAQASPAAFAAALSAVAQVALDGMESQAQTLGVTGADLGLPYTEFELLTAAALWHFRETACDWACLEVGMGGRWDATSVVTPAVSVITGVGLDHTDRLGVTREEIAADKAHIIKPGSIAVLGPGCAGVEGVLAERIAETSVPVVTVGLADQDVAWRVTEIPDRPGDETRLDVYGTFATYDGLALAAPSYQAPNVATAIAAAEAAVGGALDGDAVRAALQTMTFPGRFELLDGAPPLVLDGAHNPEAAEVLATAIGEAFGLRLPVLVLGVLEDKDVAGIVEALAGSGSAFVCTRNSSPRCMDAEVLAAIVTEHVSVPVTAIDRVSDAVRAARILAAEKKTGVVATGSLYTVGEVRATFV